MTTSKNLTIVFAEYHEVDFTPMGHVPPLRFVETPRLPPPVPERFREPRPKRLGNCYTPAPLTVPLGIVFLMLGMAFGLGICWERRIDPP